MGSLRQWGQQAGAGAVIRMLALAALAPGCGGAERPSAAEREPGEGATMVDRSLR